MQHVAAQPNVRGVFLRKDLPMKQLATNLTYPTFGVCILPRGAISGAANFPSKPACEPVGKTCECGRRTATAPIRFDEVTIAIESLRSQYLTKEKKLIEGEPMKKIISIAGYTLATGMTMLSMHCASVKSRPEAPDTAQYADRPDAEREQVYQQNGIAPAGRGKYWINGKEYNHLEISGLFGASFVSEETREKYRRAQGFQDITNIFKGAALGGILGSAAGTALIMGPAASGNKEPNMAPVGVAWGVTGALLITWIVMNGASDSKMVVATEAYNNDLYRSLDIRQKTSYNPVPLLEQYAHYSASISHRF